MGRRSDFILPKGVGRSLNVVEICICGVLSYKRKAATTCALTVNNSFVLNGKLFPTVKTFLIGECRRTVNEEYC